MEASIIAPGIGLYTDVLQGDYRVCQAMTVTGLAVSVPMVLSTLIVKRRTHANPPVFAAIFAIILLLVGGIVAWTAAYMIFKAVSSPYYENGKAHIRR